MSASTNVRLLTVDEAATLLRTTPNVVIRRCRSGEIPATKPFGSWLIRADTIDELLAAKSNTPATPAPAAPAEGAV